MADLKDQRFIFVRKESQLKLTPSAPLPLRSDTKNDEGPVHTVALANNTAMFSGRGTRMSGGVVPPPLNVVPTLSSVRRYYCNASTTVGINPTQLIGAAGLFVTGATTAFTICQAVKLNRIVMYPGLNAAGATPIPMGISWIGEIISNTGGQTIWKQKIVDRTIPDGVTQGKPIVFKPPKIFKDYILPGSNSMFVIAATEGTVIDFYGAWQLVTGANGTAPTAYTVVAGSANTIAYPYLDGPAAKIVPIGLNSIT